MKGGILERKEGRENAVNASSLGISTLRLMAAAKAPTLSDGMPSDITNAGGHGARKEARFYISAETWAPAGRGAFCVHNVSPGATTNKSVREQRSLQTTANQPKWKWDKTVK